MSTLTGMRDAPAETGHVTRAVRVTLDPSPSQVRWLRSYCGSARAAYNWSIAEVRDNLGVRAAEREAGVAEDDLTEALSWSRASMLGRFRATRDTVFPWHRDVSIHAFRTGIENASAALQTFGASRRGDRAGAPVGFPRFKNRHSKLSVRFVELNIDHRHWINADTRRHVRLMLPQRATDGTWERRHTRPRSQQATGRARRDELAWIRAHDGAATAEVWRLCDTGRARVQALTIAFVGGRWVATFQLRMLDGREIRNRGNALPWHGGVVGVDLGLHHLATLDRPVLGLTDEHGHVPNPRVLQQQLVKLARLDRAAARCRKGSRNRARLVDRRTRLHGRIAATRALHVHRLTTRLAGCFDAVVVEDLNVRGMASRGGRLGRSVNDAALGEIRRQLTYKTTIHGSRLVVIDRWHPSSQTCSACGARTKLPRQAREFACPACSARLDRDVNAACNIAAEGLRLLRAELSNTVASIRGETPVIGQGNGDPRGRETDGVGAPASGQPSFEDATVPAGRARPGSRSRQVAVA